MIDEEAAQHVVVAGFHHRPPPAVNADRSTAATAVQTQPAPARLQPIVYESRLLVVRVGAGDVSDQQLAVRQPLVDVGEVAGHGRGRPPLMQHLQQTQSGVIDVVSGERSRRKAAGYHMRNCSRSCHV